MVTLEKIDKIVERTGVSFEVARDALNETDGDIIEAIILIQTKMHSEHKGFKASDVLETLKEYIRKGNVSKIIVENDGDVVLNIPVTVGAIGVVLAPVVAVIGLGAAVMNKITVKIIDDEGITTDMNKATAEKFDDIMKAGADIRAEVKERIKAKEEARKEESEYIYKDPDITEDCHWSEGEGFSCDVVQKLDIDDETKDGSAEKVELEGEACTWREDGGIDCEPLDEDDKK